MRRHTTARPGILLLLLLGLALLFPQSGIHERPPSFVTCVLLAAAIITAICCWSWPERVSHEPPLLQSGVRGVSRTWMSLEARSSRTGLPCLDAGAPMISSGDTFVLGLGRLLSRVRDFCAFASCLEDSQTSATITIRTATP